MSKQRKQYTEEFKAAVALEALKGESSLQELAAKHGVAPGQISEWKQQLQQGAAQLFVRKNKADKFGLPGGGSGCGDSQSGNP